MKTSRLAVGDLLRSGACDVAPKGIVAKGSPDGMPLERGGIVARHNFPLDGEYEIRVAGGARLDFTWMACRFQPAPAARRRAWQSGGAAHDRRTWSARWTLQPDDIFSAPQREAEALPVSPSPGRSRPPAPEIRCRRRIFVCTPAGAAMKRDAPL
jgi:hypothetical protein